MWRIYDCIVYEHDQLYVALAVAVCALSSFTAAGVVQRAFPAEGRRRLLWLILGGVITGAGIWTTHFTAMLGFAREVGLYFDPLAAVLSFGLCTLLSILGWISGFGDRSRIRGLAAGILIGIGLAMAHFFDMTALRFAGEITLDTDLIVIALVIGIGTTMLAGPLMQRLPATTLGWPAAIAMMVGTLILHFVAMSAINLAPVGGAWQPEGVELASVGAAVVAACFMLIAAALGLAFHSHRMTQVTEADRKKLLDALEALRASEVHHRAYIELNSQIQWLADASGRVLEMGPRWWEIADITPGDDMSEGWIRVMHPDDRERVLARWAEALETGVGSIADARYRLRLRDGTYRWFRARARPFRDETGQILRWYGSLEDIDDQVAAEMALRQSEERYRLASQATNDVIWDYDFASDTATWTGALDKVLGDPGLDEGTTFQWWLDHVHPEDRDCVLAQQSAMVASGGEQISQEYRFATGDGSYIWIASRSVLVRDGEGRPVRLVGSMLDITARKQAEAELQRAAFHDPLTGLPNRALYAQRLDAAIEDARRTGEMVGLMVLDLNNFKTLNDNMGHAAGDRLLREVANRLSSTVPPGVTVARLGGDEFAIVSPGLRPADLTMKTARERLAPLEGPVTIEGLQIAISYCVGAALFPKDADNAAELLRAADLALYAAKAELPGTIRGFKPEMRQASQARAKALSNARLALANDDIVPFYQPKVDLKTGRIDGFEALLRWHDHLGLQPPASIAAAFGDAELSIRLTDRMLDRVLEDCLDWRDEQIPVGRVAINVSAADFRRGDLADRILNRITDVGLTPDAIEIEVTETVLINQLGGHVTRALETLRAAGITIALDDFGTGYASLTHLQQFPVDVLKIDRSFVDRIGSARRRDTAVIDAVMQMSRSMGIRTVAEGIERAEQAEYLREKGCDLGQGYLFSRPVPPARVAATIEALQERRWQEAEAEQLANR